MEHIFPDEKAIQEIPLNELKQLVLDMKPTGKINDLRALRLLLLGVIGKIEYLERTHAPHPLILDVKRGKF